MQSNTKHKSHINPSLTHGHKSRGNSWDESRNLKWGTLMQIVPWIFKNTAQYSSKHAILHAKIFSRFSFLLLHFYYWEGPSPARWTPFLVRVPNQTFWIRLCLPRIPAIFTACTLTLFTIQTLKAKFH